MPKPQVEKTKERVRRSSAGRPPAPFAVIRAGTVLTPETSIPDGAILVRGQRIVALGPYSRIMAAVRRHHDRSRRFILKIHDHRGLIAVPGFIDVHQHGGGGADYMDATPEAVRTVMRTHAKAGTTTIIPTLMTAPRKTILKAMAAIDAVRPPGRRGSKPAGEPAAADIPGLHLEGPFLARDKRGAQPEKHVRPFAAEEIRAILKASKTPIRIVTLAPELPGAAAFIRFLTGKGIIAAAGHSAAGFEEAWHGFEAGISHGTHLFNAMSGFGHREPGLAGALLLNDEASVELIADGHHLHPAAIFLTLAAKPPEKVLLVTDATRPAGIGKTPLRTKEGKLCGSALTLIQAVRNVIGWSDWPLADVLPLVTTNPALFLGLNRRKGRLAPGFDADIVLLDASLGVRAVYCGGRRVE